MWRWNTRDLSSRLDLASGLVVYLVRLSEFSACLLLLVCQAEAWLVTSSPTGSCGGMDERDEVF